jgi:hypothetical protein
VPSSSGLSTLALLELLDPEDGGTTIPEISVTVYQQSDLSLNA